MRLLTLCTALIAPFGFAAATPRAANERAPSAGFEGRLEASQNVLVGSSGEGLLHELRVELGDVVEAGAEIACLDPRPQQLQVELAAARASRTAGNQRAHAAVAELDRQLAQRAALFQDGLIAGSEKEELLAKRRQAEIDLLETEETLALDRLEHRRALLDLDATRIRAPIRGVVAERCHFVGEYISRGDPGIVRLLALDPLIVEVALPVQMLGAVTVGDRATLSLEHAPETLLEATVKVVERQVDTASSTFVVRLELRNEGERIPAGLRCQVRFAK